MGAQPLPGRQELEALAHAAFTSSQRLLANAELLLDHGGWPVAHALATLALEEIGKSFLCVFASTNPEPFRAEFWTAFRSHTVKIQMAHIVLAPLAATDTLRSTPFVDALEEFGLEAKADHARKLRGLYADYRDGAVLDPADIAERDARSMVSHARDGLDLLAPIASNSGSDPEIVTFLAAQSAHLMEQFDSPETGGDAFVQQLWSTILADAPDPLARLLSHLLSDQQDDGTHNDVSKQDNSYLDGSGG